MKKKILIVLIIIILIAIIMFAVYSIKNSYKNIQEGSTSNVRKEIERIYQYGEEILNMDIAPNTIVARINGEDVLKCEVDSRKYQLNHANENGNEEIETDNAFYEILIQEIGVQKYKKEGKDLGKEIYDMVTEQILNISDGELEEFYEIHKIEINERWLNEVEFKNFIIEDMLDARRGSKVLMLEYALKNSDSIENETYLERLKEYRDVQKLMEEQIETNTITNDISYSRIQELIDEIREIYIEELVLKSDIELCVEEGELSTKVPPEHIKSQDEKEDETTKQSEETQMENLENMNWEYKGTLSDFSGSYLGEFSGVDINLRYDEDSKEFTEMAGSMGNPDAVEYYIINNKGVKLFLHKDTNVRHNFYSFHFNRVNGTPEDAYWDYEPKDNIYVEGNNKVIEMKFDKTYKEGDIKNIQISFGKVD